MSGCSWPFNEALHMAMIKQLSARAYLTISSAKRKNLASAQQATEAAHMRDNDEQFAGYFTTCGE